uniref:Uncharacterized protein n=1 Tax=Plectus sambesii TaxID=2011161 RepID=A0A914X5T2_9BILA
MAVAEAARGGKNERHKMNRFGQTRPAPQRNRLRRCERDASSADGGGGDQRKNIAATIDRNGSRPFERPGRPEVGGQRGVYKFSVFLSGSGAPRHVKMIQFTALTKQDNTPAFSGYLRTRVRQVLDSRSKW